MPLSYQLFNRDPDGECWPPRFPVPGIFGAGPAVSDVILMEDAMTDSDSIILLEDDDGSETFGISLEDAP